MRSMIPWLAMLVSLSACVGGADWGGPIYHQDVRVTYAHQSSNVVRVTIWSPTGGELYIPAGTVVSTRDAGQQDLMVSRPIRGRLDPGARAQVAVQGFCVNEDRGNVTVGHGMVHAGVGRPDVVALLALSGRVPEHDLQRTIWHLLGGTHRGDPGVQRVLALAGHHSPADVRVRVGFDLAGFQRALDEATAAN